MFRPLRLNPPRHTTSYLVKNNRLFSRSKSPEDQSVYDLEPLDLLDHEFETH